MAGAGAKLWDTGDRVTSSEFQTFLQDQIIAVFADSSARDAAYGGTGEPTLAEGMFCMVKDTNEFQIYNGSAWRALLDADTISVSSGDYTISGASLSIDKDSADAVINLTAHHDTEATAAEFVLRKSDGTKASPALVDDNAVLGKIMFQGWDGDSWANGAQIRAQVDGTPADGNMPTQMIFMVTPNSSSTPVTAMTINRDKDVVFEKYVGLGTDNPQRAIDIQQIGTPEIRIQSKDGGDSAVYFGDESDAVQAGIFFDNSENDLCFRGHDNITRFKILSSGTTQFDNTMTVGSNGSGQDAVLYSNTSGSYALWDEDATLHSFNGVLRFIGNSGLSFAGTTAGADNEQIAFREDYEINCDNVGYGTGSSRFWLGGPDGGACYIGPRSGSDTWNYIRLAASTVYVYGALSKASGSFAIKHPTKGGDWRLRHSFIEGPRCDNIYRGQATIENGSATVDLDSVSDMTDGTWEALNTNGWAMVSSSGNPVTWELDGKTLTIEGPDGAVCSWLVFGERQDQHMKEESPIADDEGKLIVEYENPDIELHPDDDLPEEEDNEEEN